MPDHFSESEAARRLSWSLGADVLLRAISDLFDQRQFRHDLCSIVGGRRLIPGDFLSWIEENLCRRQQACNGRREVPLAN